MTAHNEIAPTSVEFSRDKDGRFHREDGPAIIYSNGTREWWLHGIDITVEVESWMKLLGISWPWDEEIQTQFLLAWG